MGEERKELLNQIHRLEQEIAGHIAAAPPEPQIPAQNIESFQRTIESQKQETESQKQAMDSLKMEAAGLRLKRDRSGRLWKGWRQRYRKLKTSGASSPGERDDLKRNIEKMYLELDSAQELIAELKDAIHFSF